MRLLPLTSHPSIKYSDFPVQLRRKHPEIFLFPDSLLILIQQLIKSRSSSSIPFFTFLQNIYIYIAPGCVRYNLGSPLTGLGLNMNTLCRGELCQKEAFEAEIPKDAVCVVCKPFSLETIFSSILSDSHQLIKIESWVAVFLGVYTNSIQ